MKRHAHRGSGAAALFLLAAAPLGATLAGPAQAFDGAFLPIEGGAFNVDDGPITYVLDPAGSDDINDDSDLQAVRDAFRNWACVPGTKLRFVDGGDGPAEVNLEDNQNTVFFDETGDVGMGPGTLGVNVGDVGQGVRRNADIAFNGKDHQWSADNGPSATDVGSIAIHEIGHFIGLDHPCDRNGDQEVNCNGPEESIMTPAWGGSVDRFPLPDDEQGVQSLYPKDEGDESGCEGPFRKGERCGCNDECVDGLVCVPNLAGVEVCTARCRADDADCGEGFACVLDTPEGDEPAPGVCVALAGAQKPIGSVCLGGGECENGICGAVIELERSICRFTCESDDDCENGGDCFEGVCLGAGFRDVECPVEPEGCTCSGAPLSSAPRSSSTAAGVLGLLVLCGRLAARRRRA